MLSNEDINQLTEGTSRIFAVSFAAIVIVLVAISKMNQVMNHLKVLRKLEGENK